MKNSVNGYVFYNNAEKLIYDVRILPEVFNIMEYAENPGD